MYSAEGSQLRTARFDGEVVKRMNTFSYHMQTPLSGNAWEQCVCLQEATI